MHTVALFILILAEGSRSITVTTEHELNVTLSSNTQIVLNCTYPIVTSVRAIIWKKFIHDDYKDLVLFDSGTSDVIFTSEGIYLRNRSNLIKPQNSSTSFVLMINDVMCEDDGRYQCLVEYRDGVLKEATSETTVFLQVGAEQPTNFQFYKKSTLKENDTVFLSCSANVGNPGGFVAIWKLDKSNQLLFLNKSGEVNEKTENCTAIANLNITYIVSRDDNDAIFRCTSQNRQTQKPAPYNDTTAIDVQYHPSYVIITIKSSSPDIDIGANVNLTCSSDGNPTPTFKWKFYSSNILGDERHSFTWDNRTLILKRLIFNESGIYSCFASNIVDGETRRMSSNISLKINEKQADNNEETLPATCDKTQCQISEICSVINGIAACKVNHWFFVTIIFFLFTLFFMVTTVVVVRRNRLDSSSKNFDGALKSSDHSKSKTNDYDFDGYSDPKDVTKLCQNTEKSESENVTYADPVDNQYASVQKDSPEPSKPPNVYDGAWV